MSNISKLEFSALDISGNNYLIWILDAKLHLKGMSLGSTIEEGNTASDENKSKAMIFLRHHLHEDLKREYLTIEDPLELWNAIKERYEHLREINLPKARYEWLNLRLQDFETVGDYNSALHRITSELLLCEQIVTDEDMLEKTFSTFHASNSILSQQYRERNFKKYSQLITCLMVAEKNHQLLLKTHESRPTGSSPLPEANAADHKGGRGRGRGRAPNRGRGRGRGYQNTWNRQSHLPNQSEGQSSQSNVGRPPRNYNGNKNTFCKRCGMSNHWANTCRTPKHLAEAYQYMQKQKGKNVEINFVEEAPDSSNHASVQDYHLDSADFVENAQENLDF